MDERESKRIERGAALAVAVLSFIGYLAVARIVGNVYPFSTFPMYAGEQLSTGSRIVAKDETQRLHEVTDGIAWECETPALDPNGCSGRDIHTISYVDREAIDYVREHTGSDPRARPVEIVRHIWRFPDDRGPPTTSDCRLALCRAVLR
jgi:hypothetical protein